MQYLLNEGMDRMVAEEKILDVLDERADYNPNGIYKRVRGIPVDDTDFITLPRYEPDLDPPKSFADFNFSGGNAGFAACLIGYLLGFKKIILLGFDFNFEFKDNKVLVEKTFWNSSYFSSEFDIYNEYCPYCTPKSIVETLLESFQKLQKMHGLDLDIVNCTPDSKLDTFRKSSLTQELS